MIHIYGFDMDGVLADNEWRNSMLLADPIDWNSYHLMSTSDEAHEPMCDLIHSIKGHGECCDAYPVNNLVEIWTARPEQFREITEDWLRINDVPFDTIRMRPDGDWRPAAEIKVEWLIKVNAKEGHSVAMVFDDSTKIVKAMQDTGIGMICQVNHRES